MSESVSPPTEPESFREAYRRWAAAVDAGVVPVTAADEAFIDAMLAWLDEHPGPSPVAEPDGDDTDTVAHG